ncbi:endolytic transglycosylase MltG [Nonomuraea sp. NN258]|uniref:endolytic transglycosylase MltG n=1 Tax=Nonomuraea antri TaxID=2730852 RepID=UPI0015698EE5|nr:endolytic transglycosylase MltG [Nonomuraea antri]NRQ30766.1 endolytic transglycosylase MltG [Nonomuraea antri]
MNLENLLRETLTDMADEERPPAPDRFLRVRERRSRGRGLALVAASAVAAIAIGAAVVVHGPSSRAPGDVAGPPTALSRPDVRVTVAAGTRLSRLFAELSSRTGRPVAEFERAAADGAALGLPSYAGGKLEGFAFPGVYEFSPTAGPDEILRTMLTRFAAAAEDTGLVAGARRAGRTPLEVLTIASIVQAEAGRAEDMPKIARVIHNRLNRKMRLQIDSTVRYGLGEQATGTLRARDLKSPSPYNTYQRVGLPPGPIGNPGEDAIRAALRPAAGPWLYYVTTDPANGITKFAATEAEFAELVDEQRGE